MNVLMIFAKKCMPVDLVPLRFGARGSCTSVKVHRPNFYEFLRSACIAS